MDMSIASNGNGSPSTRSNSVPPPPPTSIDNLPPELLAIVLKKEKLTLAQLIDLRAVSSHWQEVIEEHIFKLTTKLLLSDSELVDQVNESIRLPLKAELIPLVIRLFPVLADLDVRFNPEVFQRLPELLDAFSSTLTTLKLRQSLQSDMSMYIDVHQQWFTNLTSAVNSLTALTSLNLKHLPRTSAILPQLLPTFTRLQRLKFRYDCRVVETWSSITANQPLTSMTHLKMKGMTRFNHTALVRDIVASFPSLQSLHLRLRSRVKDFQNITDIFRSLSSLKHLSELTLGYLFCSPDQLNPLPSPTDQPLTSVKTLDLIFNNDINSELLSSLLVGWFPSIEECTLSPMFYFQLTTTTLRNFARFQQLKELLLKDNCLLMVELRIAPTDRPLTSLKELRVKIDARYPAEQFGSSAFVGWFPYLVELSLKFKSNLPLTTAILRDFSRLENLSNLELIGMRFEADQLHLPTSNDKRLVNVKKLGLTICQEPEDEGRYLCTALAAWFPGLKQLSILDEIEGEEIFMPSFSMLSEFATLEHLIYWHLDIAKFTTDHFPLSTSTDQVLPNLKELYLVIQDGRRNYFADGDERHIVSALASWLPNLQKFTIVFVLDLNSFNLTTDLLRELARLEHLRELKLPQMRYEKKHLQAPSSTDRPLTCLKELSLDMAELPENFDAQYFCSTFAVWFPHLEKIHVGPKYAAQVDRDTLTAYQSAIETNRHYFGRFVQLRTALSV